VTKEEQSQSVLIRALHPESSYADPAVHFCARGLSAAASRAAANLAGWRTYLPENCVVAMIKDGWHRST
jgi:hypothetical protein